MAVANLFHKSCAKAGTIISFVALLPNEDTCLSSEGNNTLSNDTLGLGFALGLGCGVADVHQPRISGRVRVW